MFTILSSRWLRFAALVSFLAAVSTVGAADPIHVNDPWVRATVPGQKVAGAYMEIVADSAAKLVGVSSPLAGSAEVHSMKMENGTMRMRRIEVLELPAGKPVKLAPGGFHVMLFDLKQPLSPGDKVPLTLVFESGGRQQKIAVTAEVRGRDDKAQHHNHH